VGRRGEVNPDLAPVRDGTRYMMSVGKSAADGAEITFQGIQERRLHIFPHPSWMAALDARIDNIRNGRPVGDEPASVFADPIT